MPIIFLNLLQTNVTTTVTINVFLADEMSTLMRFQFEERLDLEAYSPRAVTINNLNPNTRYYVYFGGINHSDSALNFASFTTLPIDDESQMRFLSVYNTQVIYLNVAGEEGGGE